MKPAVLPVVLSLAIGCGAEVPKASQTQETAGGRLELGDKTAAGQCPVLLGGAVVLRIDCRTSYPPRVLGRFMGDFGRFEEVIVVQEQPMGNACNGGPLHFLGIRNDGHEVSGPIDFCGGADPVLTHDGDRLRVTFPGGPPNRGETAVADEVWHYEDGRVTKVY